MKKTLALILALTMLLSLGACSKRPDAAPDASAPQSGPSLPSEPAPGISAQPEASPEISPEAEPAETPQPPEAEQPDDEEPFEEPEPSEEPAMETEEPAEEPSEEPEEKPSAPISSTATDLAPGDDSYLELIPELPYENWASTAIKNGVMLELSGLGADAAQALQDYLEDLREDGFEVKEYLAGMLYEAKKDDLTVKLMLEGGVFTVTVEKV